MVERDIYRVVQKGNEVYYTLNEIKEMLTPIFERYNLEQAILYGDYEEGQPIYDNDIGICYVPNKETGLDAFFSLSSSIVERLDVWIRPFDKEIFDAEDILEDEIVTMNEIKETGVIIYEKKSSTSTPIG